MPFPTDFLTQLAKDKKLSDRETEVFLMLFGAGKSRVQISQTLNISESAVSTTLGKVYEKFRVGIGEVGPVKESRLKDWLTDRLRERDSKTPFVQSRDGSEATFHVESSSDDWIEEVRSRCCEKILYQHSTIQLLNQAEIGVDQLYVDVWLLDRCPRTFQPGSTMLKSFDLRNDRLGMGDRVGHSKGMKVASDNSRLSIVGKPGTGKTTFLKHLAVDCSNGKFQSDLIPVLLELRRIQSTEWKLLDAIAEELSLDNQQTQKLLEQGKLLILLDGLDEVPTSDFRRTVQNQIRDLAQKPEHSRNRVILTCRTQIIEVIPQGFAAVEVAEFSDEQVEKFVKNWFRASGQTEAYIEQQWQVFADAVKQNSALKELTVTPVLLSLMCWVFQDSGELPSQAVSLYRKGIRLLLEKWNDLKEIPEWEIGTQVYREREPDQKEALLIEIAARKFENPDNFVLFEQKDLAKQIANFLNLANAREGEAVLKAIEAQHGLLVERADELWSFSHLTFQEYFAAKWLTQSPRNAGLAKKIDDNRWRGIIGLAVNLQEPTDELLQWIKHAIDYSVSQDIKIQEFLTWMQEKAKASSKPSEIRAFYFALAFARTLGLDPDLAPSLARDLVLDSFLSHECDLALSHPRDSDFARDLALFRAFDNARNLHHFPDRNYIRRLDHNLVLACDLSCESEVKNRLQPLRTQLLENLSVQSWDDFQNWWRMNGQAWIEKLRQVMTEPCKLVCDWHLTESQKQVFYPYHDAIKFLIQLLRQPGAVSDRTRQEIEDNLLLPIATLRERLPEMYGE